MTTLASAERTIVDHVRRRLFIDGEWRDATDGATLPVEDPSTGQTLCDVADASPEDALAALDAASRAQPSTSRTLIDVLDEQARSPHASPWFPGTKLRSPGRRRLQPSVARGAG